MHFDHIVGGVATGRHGWRAGDQVDRAAREREVRAVAVADGDLVRVHASDAQAGRADHDITAGGGRAGGHHVFVGRVARVRDDVAGLNAGSVDRPAFDRKRRLADRFASGREIVAGASALRVTDDLRRFANREAVNVEQDATAEQVRRAFQIDTATALLAAQVRTGGGADDQLQVGHRAAVVSENLADQRAVAVVASGAERRGAGGAVGARCLLIGSGQLGFDFVHQRAHGLGELVAQNGVVIAGVVQAALIFAGPVEGHGLAGRDRHGIVADGRVARVRAGRSGGNVSRRVGGHDREINRFVQRCALG